MGTVPIDGDVKLIRLHLPDAIHAAPQVVLQRVAGEAGKDVDEPVVTELGGEGLFIVAE